MKQQTQTDKKLTDMRQNSVFKVRVGVVLWVCFVSLRSFSLFIASHKEPLLGHIYKENMYFCFVFRMSTKCWQHPPCVEETAGKIHEISQLH